MGCLQVYALLAPTTGCPGAWWCWNLCSRPPRSLTQHGHPMLPLGLSCSAAGETSSPLTQQTCVTTWSSDRPDEFPVQVPQPRSGSKSNTGSRTHLPVCSGWGVTEGRGPRDSLSLTASFTGFPHTLFQAGEVCTGEDMSLLYGQPLTWGTTGF